MKVKDFTTCCNCGKVVDRLKDVYGMYCSVECAKMAVGCGPWATEEEFKAQCKRNVLDDAMHSGRLR